jgi:hypothetical protein
MRAFAELRKEGRDLGCAITSVQLPPEFRQEFDHRITIQQVTHTDTRFASFNITPRALK